MGLRLTRATDSIAHIDNGQILQQSRENDSFPQSLNKHKLILLRTLPGDSQKQIPNKLKTIATHILHVFDYRILLILTRLLQSHQYFG